MRQLVNIVNLVVHALDMYIWTVIIVQSRLLCKPYMTSHVKYPIKHPVVNTTRNTNSGSPSIDQQLRSMSNYHAQLIVIHTSYNQLHMSRCMLICCIWIHVMMVNVKHTQLVMHGQWRHSTTATIDTNISNELIYCIDTRYAISTDGIWYTAANTMIITFH